MRFWYSATNAAKRTAYRVPAETGRRHSPVRVERRGEPQSVMFGKECRNLRIGLTTRRLLQDSSLAPAILRYRHHLAARASSSVQSVEQLAAIKHAPGCVSPGPATPARPPRIGSRPITQDRTRGLGEITRLPDARSVRSPLSRQPHRQDYNFLSSGSFFRSGLPFGA